MIRTLILSLSLSLGAALAAGPALAHKVVASAYPSGTVIEGEIGFSNGDMAKDAKVEVFGPDGKKLGETQTDGEGSFTFAPSEPVAHEFKSDLGAGHKADFTVSQEDVEQVLGMQKDAAEAKAEQTTGKPAETAAPGTAAPAAVSGLVELSMADKLAIAKMVRDEVKPLRREIDAYKEHNNMETILGGIGYIIGLFGIGYYVAGRRRKAA